MQYKYFYTKRTAAKIRSFYRNVAKKYQHTYSYAYTIEGDTITVVDACHAQNMHD